MIHFSPIRLPLLERLPQHFPGTSNTTLKKWLVAGRVLVNGEAIKRANTLVHDNAKISLANKEKPLPFDIKTLFFDSEIIVVQKPQGLLSVATDREKERTVHAALKKEYGWENIFVIHRLDRETSGVLLFAKTPSAARFINHKFLKHDLYREYIGYVAGAFKKPEGTYSSYLAEDASHHVNEIQDKNRGELAITHYKTLSYAKGISKVRFVLQTGKKNQIRVHCTALGCPIIGDKRYGSALNPVNRLCLHANTLKIQHPKSLEMMTFLSPQPSVFQRLMK